jgi:hypothetical protein
VHEEIESGVIGRAVGAPFVVLVAEDLFACRCQLLISITSARQIISKGGLILPGRYTIYHILEFCRGEASVKIEKQHVLYLLDEIR